MPEARRAVMIGVVVLAGAAAVLVLATSFARPSLETFGWNKLRSKGAIEAAFSAGLARCTTNEQQWLPLLDSWKDADNATLHDCLDDRLLAFGTRRALSALRQHQTSGNARTVLCDVFFTGIGSNTHVEGSFVGLAVQHGRVALRNPGSGHGWANGIPDGFCPAGEAKPGFACFLRPLVGSQAQRQELLARLGAEGSIDGFTVATHETCAADAPETVVAKFPDTVEPSSQSLRALGDVLLHDGVSDEAVQYYWWRAIAAAYTLRFTDAMRELIRERFWALYPKPIPRGCVSVHARMGDKATETDTTPWPAYWEATMRLIRSQPFALRPCVILTTGTKAAADAAKADAAREGVHLVMADIERVDEGSPFKNIEIRKPFEEYVTSMAHLVAALHADAFVGTRTSNWCRLIDELRATVTNRALAPFVDMHEERLGTGQKRFDY